MTCYRKALPFTTTTTTTTTTILVAVVLLVAQSVQSALVFRLFASTPQANLQHFLCLLVFGLTLFV